MVDLELKHALREAVTAWASRLEKALLQVENSRRQRTNRKPYSEDVIVWMPLGPNAELLLLTLKVWSMRYCVTPEFILDVLTLVYKQGRKYDPNNDKELHLGLPASLIASASARQRLEEAVIKTYPNGENRKSYNLPSIKLAWSGKEDLDPDRELKNYLKTIPQKRIQFENEIRRQRFRELHPRRNFRRA